MTLKVADWFAMRRGRVIVRRKVKAKIRGV